MNYNEKSRLQYVYEEDEAADIEQGRKWVFRDGAAILGINLIYMVASRFVLSGNFAKIFLIAAIVGMIFGIILMTRTRHCRKFFIASLVLSALPAVVIMIMTLINGVLPDFGRGASDSSKLLVWLAETAVAFFGDLLWLLIKTAVIFAYAAIYVFAYIDLFETKDVIAYIKYKRTKTDI